MRKLTEKEIKERQIKKAICSIKKLEKYYPTEILSLASNRYAVLYREKRKAISEKRELEQKLADLKEKLK